MHERGIKLVRGWIWLSNHSKHLNMNGLSKAEVQRNNPYRNYYHWWNAVKTESRPYRYSLFDINHDA